MVTIAEFRVPEENAAEYLEADCGHQLLNAGVPSVRKVVTPVGSELYHRVGELDRRMKGLFFLGWNLTHKYTKCEITQAELFHIGIAAVFEPVGWECGTVYDDSSACSFCGGGNRQLNDLRLDLRRVPREKDLAKTLAEEWIVSERLAGLMADEGVTGYELRPVRQKAFWGEASIDLRRVPSGRVLLERAQVLDLDLNSPEFFHWLWASEQRDLTEMAEAENLERLKKRYAASKKPGKWFQLLITAPRVPLVPLTLLGVNPFNHDEKGENRCIYAGETDHVAGLNLLSEVSISRSEWDGSDIVCTRQLVGANWAYVRARPLILISPRFRRLLIEHKVKGWRDEVAYLR